MSSSNNYNLEKSLEKYKTILLSSKTNKKKKTNSIDSSIDKFNLESSVKFNVLDTNINNPRKFGLWSLQSSHTYQNSNLSYTIPKEERFKLCLPLSSSIIPNNKSNVTFLNSSNMKDIRATSLGYGVRKFFPVDKFKQNSPSPNVYKVEYPMIKKNPITIKGKLENLTQNSLSKIPGPGQYNINDTYNINDKDNKHYIGTSIKSRHGFFYDEDIKQKKHQVSPQKYNPSFSVTKPSRFTNIKFLKKERDTLEECKHMLKNPGPGQYYLPSIFDLKRKYKPCLN